MDQDLFLTVHLDDPRAWGKVKDLPASSFMLRLLPPACQQHRPMPLDKTRGLEYNTDYQFLGNQCGRWVECDLCGLRVGYWPRKGFTGKHRITTHPAVMSEALGGMEEIRMALNRTNVRNMVKMVEAQIALEKAMSKKATPPSAAKSKAAPAAVPKSWPTPPTMKTEVKTEVKTETKTEPLVETLAQDIPIYPMDEDDEEEEIPGPRNSMTSAASRKPTPGRRKEVKTVSFGKPRGTGRSSSRGRSPDQESGSTSSTASWEQLAADSQPG
jgi:hypothetical protein